MDTEVSEGYKHGLLSSVKEQANVYNCQLGGEELKVIYGVIAEEILVKWAYQNRHELLKPYIYDERYKIRCARPKRGRAGRCYFNKLVYKGIFCDYLFLIDQPSIGRSFVMFEAKYGNATINQTQAQYYRKAYWRPWEIIPEAREGHVVLSKIFYLNLKKGEFTHYTGELIVPDELPEDDSVICEACRESWHPKMGTINDFFKEHEACKND